MTYNAQPIRSLQACTSPQGNNALAIVGYYQGTANTYKTALSNLLGNTTANVYVKDGYNLSTPVVVARCYSTPSNSTSGGLPPNSMWFDDTSIYCCLANGYIKKASLIQFSDPLKIVTVF